MWSNKLKYPMLIVGGLILILVSNVFHAAPRATPVKPGDEYYLSSLLGHYTVFTAILFFIAGLAVGYYWKLDPWLTGIFLIAVFPLTSIFEATVYKGSHNLIPFELAFHFIWALPAIVGAYAGKFALSKQKKVRINKNQKMPNALTYLLLAVGGPIIILCCSFFQHVSTPLNQEYYYSSLLRDNYTMTARIIFFVVGLAVGHYFNLNPWLTGICLILIFPLISIIEALTNKGTHTELIPIEVAVYFMYALPPIVGAFIGRLSSKMAAKRKERLAMRS